MTTILDITQVGVGVPDREGFENFARDMLGFPVSRTADGAVTYIRSDRYPHRITATTARESTLRYLGFDVGGKQELADWQTKLTAECIHWRHGTAEECAERRVKELRPCDRSGVCLFPAASHAQPKPQPVCALSQTAPSNAAPGQRPCPVPQIA